jgi:5'-3' exonuclease
LVVADDTKPYFRSKAYPRYKLDRVKSTEQKEVSAYVKKSKDHIRELLHAVGAKVLAAPGYEADDIIAHNAILPTLFPNDDKVYIASSDTDLYQILLKHNRILLCHKKGLYGYKEFKAEFGLEPSQWARVLAIAGSHNGVPGIKGIGLKTAAKLVRENVTNRFLAYKHGVQAEDIELRWRLSCYPWHEDGHNKPSFSTDPIKYNRRQMIAWCYWRFGIDFAGYMQSAFEALTK